MEVGQEYRPYKKFVGSMVPNCIMRNKEISQGAKLCFGRLAQYQGKTGEAFPSQKALADELGVSDRMVRKYLDELIKKGFIKVIARGNKETCKRYSNVYIFIWDEDLEFKSEKKKENDDKLRRSLEPDVLAECESKGTLIPTDEDLSSYNNRTTVPATEDYSSHKENHIRESKEENHIRDSAGSVSSLSVEVEEERKVDTVKKELEVEKENNFPLPEKVEEVKEEERKYGWLNAKEFREYHENAEVRQKHQESVLLDYFCDEYKKFSTNGEYIVSEGDGELLLRTYLNVGGKGFYEEAVKNLFNRWDRISTDFQVEKPTIKFLYDNSYKIYSNYKK